MHAYFYVESLNEAIDNYGLPEICKTEQGSQFIGSVSTMTLFDAGLGISADG